LSPVMGVPYANEGLFVAVPGLLAGPPGSALPLAWVEMSARCSGVHGGWDGKIWHKLPAESMHLALELCSSSKVWLSCDFLRMFME
jgi:hypothetical protein